MITPLHALWIVLAGLAVLFLPGVCWLAWTRRERADTPALAADALGISVAVTAILALLTFLLKLRVSAGWALAFYGLLALAAAGGVAFRGYYERLAAPYKTWQRERRFDWGALALVLAGAAVLAWRLYQARGLAFPAWVDSIHHTLIVRAMLDNGRLPGSLAPLIDAPLYYHVGFHSVAAVFAGMARLSSEQAVLWIGQALNAGVCLSAYRLSVTVWKDWRAGAAAALLMAFFSQMPAYYLTWGRYTLLTGLLVLPLAMSAALQLFEQPRLERAARLALLTAGLLLAHYLAALLLALFLILLGLAQVWRELRRRKIEWRAWAARIGAPLAGLAVAAPWLARIGQYAPNNWRVTPYFTEEAFSRLVTPGGINYLVFMLGPRHNYVLLGLGALGLLAALFHPRGLSIAAWALLIMAFSLPFGLRLGPFRPDHYAIVLFLPACLLAGWLLARSAAAAASVLGRIRPGYRRWAGGLLWVALALWCAWGLRETRDVVNPVTIIATRADRAALNWIAEYAPPEARFYINTTLWQGITYRGVDGGAWITTQTGRFALVPAVVYEWGAPAYREQIRRWAETASRARGCSPEFWSVAREAGITHVYLRRDKGPALAADFATCPGVEAVYDLNGVTILRITRLP